MALSLAVFSGYRHPIPRSSSSPAIVTSSFQNMPRSIDHHKRRAAAYGQSLVSSPPHSTHLPNGTDNLTDRSESLHERRLEQVRHLVGTVEKGSLESLVMLDALQRLGIAYRFEEETQSILQEQHLISAHDGHHSSLYEVALRFRLLRQEGFFVSAGTCSKYYCTCGGMNVCLAPRWECMEELPDYMKTCFRALDDITNEISYNIYKKHGWNPTHLLRESWMSLCDAFLVEARWFTSGHSPSTAEYLDNAIVTTGVPAVMAHSFAHLCEGMNRHTLGVLNGRNPGISLTTAKILRLWDDLGSAKNENQEGHDGSYVDYYMRENPSCSLERARDRVKEMISDAWKSLNRECLLSHTCSPSMARASLDTARLVPLMYAYDENHCLPRMEEEHMRVMMVSRWV